MLMHFLELTLLKLSLEINSFTVLMLINTLHNNILKDLRRPSRINDSSRSGQRARLADQIAVDLTSRLTTLGDGPDNQRLSSAAIAGCEHLRIRRAISSDRGFDVSSAVQVEICTKVGVISKRKQNTISKHQLTHLCRSCLFRA